ncbi:MAG: hypothetical protein NC206_10300 [Bacteroides sp.]|nr:hypothetical protein [Bacteroides sp.]
MRTNKFYCYILIALICIGCNHTNKEAAISETKKEAKPTAPSAASPKQEATRDSVKATDNEKAYTHSVYYYYYYELQNTRMDDNIIEIRYDGDSVVEGYFWGTSDEFDEAREGYYPGFIVLPMKELKIRTDSIFFALDSRGKDYFSNYIDVSIHSCEEAKENGYHPWLQYYSYFYDSVSYKCAIVNDTIILNNNDKSKYRYNGIKKFVKTDLEDIKKINRSLGKEEEIQNRKNNTDNYTE